MHVSWKKLPIITRRDRANPLDQTAPPGKIAKAAPRGHRLQTRLLLRLGQRRRCFNLDRGRFRVGNSLYLDVMSLVVGKFIWILDGPDLVVAVGDQSELGPLLEM